MNTTALGEIGEGRQVALADRFCESASERRLRGHPSAHVRAVAPRLARCVPGLGGDCGRSRHGEGAARPAIHSPVPRHLRSSGRRIARLRLRSLAAYRYVEGHGVLSGHSAAALLGADCAPEGAPAEVTVSGGRRTHPGLRVHRDVLRAEEVRPCRGVQVTSPPRTAYDLGRRPDLIEAVVGIDGVANVCWFDPGEVLTLAERHAGARMPESAAGSGPSGPARRLADGDATAARAGLARMPTPEVQFPVLDDVRRRAVWLDLAYPEHRIGIEYEGADHACPERALRDTGRYTWLVDRGLRMYRFTKYQVYAEPDEVAATIDRALTAR